MDHKPRTRWVPYKFIQEQPIEDMDDLRLETFHAKFTRQLGDDQLRYRMYFTLHGGIKPPDVIFHRGDRLSYKRMTEENRKAVMFRTILSIEREQERRHGNTKAGEIPV